MLPNEMVEVSKYSEDLNMSRKFRRRAPAFKALNQLDNYTQHHPILSSNIDTF